MSSDNAKRAIDRMLRRSELRQGGISLDDLSRSVARAIDREEGARLTRAPEAVHTEGRPASTPGHKGGPDMRSQLVRQVVEMAVLSGEQGLLRAEEPGSQAAAGSGSGSDGESGGGTPFEDWYKEMKAKGLTDPEIEEHMAQRIRALRRQLVEMEGLRSIARRSK